MKFETQINALLSRVNELPASLFTKTEGGQYEVLWLLNRQKPSVDQCYDFDEERLGITKDGKIIWGFDSGCSCPIPWEDCGDEIYEVKEWKEFEVSDLSQFDTDWEDEILKNIEKL